MAFLEEWSASPVSRTPHYLIPALAIGVLYSYWPESPERLAGMCLLSGAVLAELLRDARAGDSHPFWSFAYYALVAAATLILLDPVLGRYGIGGWQVVASLSRPFGSG